jgi:ribonuclease P protein component
MRETIKKHKDFAMTEDEPKFVCMLFIARARLTKWSGNAKYGLIATKKTFRHAVDRNRAKRLLRAWIRSHAEKMSPNMDYVFIARRPILDASLPQGTDFVRKAIKKLKK